LISFNLQIRLCLAFLSKWLAASHLESRAVDPGQLKDGDEREPEDAGEPVHVFTVIRPPGIYSPLDAAAARRRWEFECRFTIFGITFIVSA
jgi:hypothetical protein